MHKIIKSLKESSPSEGQLRGYAPYHPRQLTSVALPVWTFAILCVTPGFNLIPTRTTEVKTGDRTAARQILRFIFLTRAWKTAVTTQRLAIICSPLRRKIIEVLLLLVAISLRTLSFLPLVSLEAKYVFYLFYSFVATTFAPYNLVDVVSDL